MGRTAVVGQTDALLDQGLTADPIGRGWRPAVNHLATFADCSRWQEDGTTTITYNRLMATR